MSKRDWSNISQAQHFSKTFVFKNKEGAPAFYTADRTNLLALCDRSIEQQPYRASGLNLVTAAVVLWNTVYLERATNAPHGNGHAVDDALLQYLSPLGWEHMTGDYLWHRRAKIGAGKFRPLRPFSGS